VNIVAHGGTRHHREPGRLGSRPSPRGCRTPTAKRRAGGTRFRPIPGTSGRTGPTLTRWETNPAPHQAIDGFLGFQSWHRRQHHHGSVHDTEPWPTSISSCCRPTGVAGTVIAKIINGGGKLSRHTSSALLLPFRRPCRAGSVLRAWWPRGVEVLRRRGMARSPFLGYNAGRRTVRGVIVHNVRPWRLGRQQLPAARMPPFDQQNEDAHARI